MFAVVGLLLEPQFDSVLVPLDQMGDRLYANLIMWDQAKPLSILFSIALTVPTVALTFCTPSAKDVGRWAKPGDLEQPCPPCASVQAPPCDGSDRQVPTAASERLDEHPF
jgi:hypothetical protein